MWILFRMGERKLVQMVQVTRSRWPPYPYMVKNFKNFFSGTERPMTLKLGMQHRVLEYYQVCSNDAPWLTLTYFTARSNLVAYAFVWEKVKTMAFSETIVVYDINIGRCSQLNEYMKLWVPNVKVIHWPCSKSLSFNIFKLLFLNNPLILIYPQHSVERYRTKNPLDFILVTKQLLHNGFGTRIWSWKLTSR